MPEVNTDAQETVTAILLWKKGPITKRIHLSSLTHRAHLMIMAEEEPREAAENLADHMEGMGLAPYGQTIRSPYPKSKKSTI